ncbi:MAG: SH3 domain-containing protein [Anaerolineae bacterium]|nr:SH3 domain-containing protein [Anaerolineae bacterium]
MLRRALSLVFFLLLATTPVLAQSDNSVARARVTSAGVEIQRIGTSTWVPIRVESLIGVGDSIRTTDKGRATVSFLDDVLTIDLSEQSELGIDAYTGEGNAFTVRSVLRSGFARFKSLRNLGDSEQFLIVMPGFTTTVQQGTGNLRVESSGRSALLVVADSKMSVKAKDSTATVGENNGVRADADGALSDVVPALTFPQLDSSLDGCPSSIKLDDDVRLNVRLGASRSYPLIGGLQGNSTIQAMGITASGGWYRIRFKDGFGWVQVRTLPLDRACAGLRLFSDNFGPEDAKLYTDLTDAYDVTVTATPTP